jgi:hypothetical protein
MIEALRDQDAGPTSEPARASRAREGLIALARPGDTATARANRRRRRHIVAAAIAGTTIGWYDFYQLGSVPAGLLVPAFVILLPDRAQLAIELGIACCCLLSASALVPPRRLLGTVAVLAGAGTASMVARTCWPVESDALIAMAADYHSPLWGWINNLSSVLSLVAPLLVWLAWLADRRRARAG